MEYQKFALSFFIIGVLLVIIGIVWERLPSLFKQRKSISRYQQENIRKAQRAAGERAEQQVRFQLQYLQSENYEIWNNVYLEFNGIRHEFDHIIFSSSGIIHIETKNYGGEIKFTINGIEQIKRNSSGTIVSEKNIKDPTGQLTHHEFLIKRILGEINETGTPVYGVLCIANERTSIHGKPDGFHICKDSMLLPYITSLQTHNNYTKEWRKSLISLFEQYKVKIGGLS